jgi:alkylation response protein AidB-like acyl-CoA dehydrogenase
MNFTFTDEQQMLQHSCRRYLQDHASVASRPARIHQPITHDNAIWQGLADLGLLALHVAPEYDGLGCGPIEAMLVMQEAGACLLLEPLAASAIVATCLLQELATASQCAEWLPQLAQGHCIAVLAHEESTTGDERLAINTTVVQDGAGFRLQGHKCVIPHAMGADLLLVSARLDNQLCIVALPRTTAGLRIVPCPLVDGTLAADLFFDGVLLPATALLGTPATDAQAALCNALDRGLAAICAEAVGALDKLLAATAEHCRTRQQFGVPIASFQALRHRLADMLMHVEQARSMSYLAAVRCTEPDLAARAQELAAAKVVIGQACSFVGQQAVQLHGGMGVTDELEVSHYFKRLMAIELQCGSTEQHLQSFAALMTCVELEAAARL